MRTFLACEYAFHAKYAVCPAHHIGIGQLNMKPKIIGKDGGKRTWEPKHPKERGPLVSLRVVDDVQRDDGDLLRLGDDSVLLVRCERVVSSIRCRG